MAILVTGATGFIGRHAVRRLVDEGLTVRCLVRPGRPTEDLAALGVEVHRGDVTEPAGLTAPVSGCEAVVHLAALLGAWGVSERALRRVNVEGTRNLLTASAAAGVRRFVHVSTPGVVGIRGLALATEEDEPRPTGAYERTKWQAEQVVTTFAARSGVEFVVVRPDFVYGPGDERRLELFRRVAAGRMRLLGDGSARIRPTYVDDVSQGIVLALGHPAAAGEVFNIAGPRLVSFREYFEAMARALGAPAPRPGIPVWMAHLAAVAGAPAARLFRRPPLVTRSRVRFLTVDHGTEIAKARRLLGFEPRVDLEEGLARTVAWYREKGLL